jgi:glycine cleavage system regulatory protein
MAFPPVGRPGVAFPPSGACPCAAAAGDARPRGKDYTPTESEISRSTTLPSSLVLTVIGADKPGLVEALSEAVASHEGNWLESRMARLSGRFAGILRVSVPPERTAALAAALSRLEERGLRVVVETSVEDEGAEPHHGLQLELVGADRPGIVREISRVLAERGVNVDELSSECTSAPMSGEALFRASARLRVPVSLPLEELRARLEALAHDLMVDLTLDEP